MDIKREIDELNINNFITYLPYMDTKTRISLFIIGALIIAFTIYFFIFVRGFLLSFASVIIIITCLFLMFFSIYPNKSVILFFGMNIEEMELSNAQHYHSMITTIIIGFSAIIGVGITIVWSSKGDVWKTNNFWLFAILLIYFILVMYFVFVKKLQKQIVEKNKKRKK